MARINNSRKALFQTPGSTAATDEHPILPSSQLSKLDIAEKALANVHAENEFNLASKESHKERMNKLKSLLNEIEEVSICYKKLIRKFHVFFYFSF
jgi:hypothetical protein